jgi:putative transposase
MERYEITDDNWERIEPLLPGREGDPGAHGKDNRQFLNAVIWMARTGAPWRSLPAEFGEWNSVFQRFNRWSKAGVWQRVFEAFKSSDLRTLMLDSTIIRAHQHEERKKKGGPKVTNRSGGRAADLARNCTPRAREKVTV